MVIGKVIFYLVFWEKHPSLIKTTDVQRLKLLKYLPLCDLLPYMRSSGFPLLTNIKQALILHSSFSGGTVVKNLPPNVADVRDSG